jgi:hypothetical protein
VLLFAGPLLIKAMVASSSITSHTCNSRDPGRTIVFKASRGSFLHRVPASFQGRYPDINPTAYVAGAPDTAFSNAAIGSFVGTVFDCVGGKEWTYLILDKNPADYAGHYVTVRAHKVGRSGYPVYAGSICEGSR